MPESSLVTQPGDRARVAAMLFHGAAASLRCRQLYGGGQTAEALLELRALQLALQELEESTLTPEQVIDFEKLCDSARTHEAALRPRLKTAT